MRRVERFSIYETTNMLNSHYKNSIIGVLLIFQASSVVAVPLMPSTPQNLIGGDSVRGRDGTTCTQGTHVGPTLDFGVATSRNNFNTDSQQQDFQNQQFSLNNNSGNDIGFYARIIVPLGNDPERIDCTQLYSLEIERLKMELESMKKAGASAVAIE